MSRLLADNRLQHAFRRLSFLGLILAAQVTPGRAWQAPVIQYSPRLGIFYELIPNGSTFWARLAAPPVPGSPLRQAQVQLELGDQITHLDNMPISNAADLENHFKQTSVAFVNVNTGLWEVRWVFLPVLGDAGVPSSNEGVEIKLQEGYSPRFGVYYELIPQGRAFGARLIAAPVPGSPLRQAQIQLERGDMITHLDNMPINGPADLEIHFARTSVQFVNMRTGFEEVRWVYLAARNDPGVPPVGRKKEPREENLD